MDPRIAPFWAAFRMNTRLLLNSFEGVDEETARERPDPRTNSMEFLALHLVESRFFLLGLLGAASESPFPDLEAIRSNDELQRYPPLDEVLAAWRDSGDRLDARLAEVDAELLDSDSPQAFPLADGSVLGGVAFLFQHEAYHLGQLGFLRKQHGLEAMRYS